MAESIRRAGLWTALAALVFLTVQGFYKSRLFAQYIWTADGFRTLLLFAAVYVAFCAVFLLWRPGLLVPATIIAVVVFTIAAVGLAPPLAVALFLLSSLVLGQSIWRGDALLSTLLGISIYMFILSIVVQAPLNYPLVYLAALLAPLTCNYKLTAGWLRRLPSLFRPRPMKGAELFAACGLIFVLLVHWLVVLEPEAGVDALAMHLVVPSQVAASHYWPFDVREHVWAVMPMGGDWCYAIVYLLGGEQAPRLLNFSFLLGIVLLLRRAARSALIAALFAATPVVLLVTGSLFVENLWALLAFGSLLTLARFRERGDSSYLYVACVLLGAACATKFGALAFVPPMLGAALWAIWHRPPKRMLRACGAAALLLMFAAPPYVIAYVKTGNPVFPFHNGPSSPEDVRFKRKPSIHTLSDLTFHSGGYIEGQDGAAGFQYFLLFPLGILLVRRDWDFSGVAAGIVFIAFTVITMEAQSNLRYLYAGFPFAMLFVARSIAALKTIAAPLYRTVLGVSALILVLDIYFLPSSGWGHKDFVTNPLSARARSLYIMAHAPVRHLVDYMNRRHPGQPAAFFESNAIAGLRAPAYTSMWHTPDFSNRLWDARSSADIRHLMLDYRVKYLIVPDRYVAPSTSLQAFLKQWTAPEYRSGSFWIVRVLDNAVTNQEAPLPPAGPGEYDDRDPHVSYLQAWTHGDFPKASHGTITFSEAPGAAFRFTFIGTEIGYVYTRAFNRGTAQVTIDGVNRGPVKLYSPGVAWQSETRFRCQARGPHTIEVRNAGKAFIDLDALRVR